jgi:hypothetical protein
MYIHYTTYIHTSIQLQLSRSRVYRSTHTYMHAYIHIYIHCIHSYTPAFSFNSPVAACISAYIYTYTTHIHTDFHTLHTHIHTYMYMCVCACVHTHTYKYIPAFSFNSPVAASTSADFASSISEYSTTRAPPSLAYMYVCVYV